jgi:polyisoprenyl-teichoic acid--peptidoglycan teichoic acid transferase
MVQLKKNILKYETCNNLKEKPMNGTRIVNKKSRRSKRIRRLILLLLILIIVPIGSYLGLMTFKTYVAAEKSYNELDRGNQSSLREEAVTISNDPVSILLIGLENYTTNFKGGRTDSLMLATFNPKLKTMKLVSIPRDTYVYIDAKGEKDKITHAYGVGGRDETIKTVENFLDIPIDYYVEVNFKGFKDIIDEMGGVDVQVPFSFSEYTDTHPRKELHFEEGPATLNGKEALAFARMRKEDPRGDFGRNDRQKDLIKAIIDELSSPSNLLKIDEIATHLGKNVQTNLKMSEPINFYKKYKGFSSQNIQSLKIEGEDTYIDDIYYFSANEEKLLNLTTELQEHLNYIKTP